MPLKIDVSPVELKRAKIVSPDWYGCKIENIVREMNKDKTAYNYVFTYVGLNGEAKDCTFKEWVSEKSMGRIGEIAKAMRFDFDEDTGIQGLDLEDWIGGNIDILVKTGDFNGQPKNEVAGHRPYTA